MENENSIVVHGELYHWGIKGMKWGYRRYQNPDGSLTPAGKKRYDNEMANIKAETKRIKNQQRTDAKLAKLEEAKKNLKDLKRNNGKSNNEFDEIEDIEAKKNKILESRSPKALYENANLFTFNELNAARMRLELERSIKNLEPPAIDKGKELTDKFSKNAESVANMAQSGTKAYNSMAKIYNSLVGNKNGATLPLIGDSAKSKLDKFKEDTEWIKAQNERKKVDKEAKGEKSEQEKFKEETERIKAQNERDKALDEYNDRHSDYGRMKEETERIVAENKNREAKRTSRQHDESDRKEAKKAEEDAVAAQKEAAKWTNDFISKFGDTWPDSSESSANAGKSYVDWRSKEWDNDGFVDWRSKDWDDD